MVGGDHPGQRCSGSPPPAIAPSSCAAPTTAEDEAAEPRQQARARAGRRRGERHAAAANASAPHNAMCHRAGQIRASIHTASAGRQSRTVAAPPSSTARWSACRVRRRRRMRAAARPSPSPAGTVPRRRAPDRGSGRCTAPRRQRRGHAGAHDQCRQRNHGRHAGERTAALTIVELPSRERSAIGNCSTYSPNDDNASATNSAATRR